MSLRFAADNSEVHFNLPAAANFSDEYTIAILIRMRSTPNFYAMVDQWDSSDQAQIDFEIDNSQALFLEQGGNFQQDDTDGQIHADTSFWHIYTVSYSFGSVEFGDCEIGSSWFINPGSNPLSNPGDMSGGSIVVGAWQGGQDDLDANVAVVAGWPFAFAPSDYDALITNLRTSDWVNTPSGPPAYLFEFLSTSSIPDLMGNGATLTSAVATVDGAENPPGWTYDGTGPKPTTASGTTGSASVAVPSGLKQGDEVILIHSNDNGNGSTIPTPSGFTVLANGFIAGDGQRYWIGWKRMGATPDSGSYSQNISAQSWVMACIPLPNRDSTNPPVLSAINQRTSSGSTATATGLTALAGDDLLMIVVPDAVNTNVVTHSAWPAPFNEIVDVGIGWAQIGVAKADNVAAGATGNKTATMTPSAGYAAWILRAPAAVTGSGGGTVTVGTTLSQLAALRNFKGVSILQAAAIRNARGVSLSQAATVRLMKGASLSQQTLLRALRGASLSQLSGMQGSVGASILQRAALRRFVGAPLSQRTLIRLAAGSSVDQPSIIRALSGASVAQQAVIRSVAGRSLTQPSVVRLLIGSDLDQLATLRNLSGTSLVQNASVVLQLLTVGATLQQRSVLRNVIGASLEQDAMLRALLGSALAQDAHIRNWVSQSLNQYSAIMRAAGGSLGQSTLIRALVSDPLVQIAAVRILLGASLEQDALVQGIAHAVERVGYGSIDGTITGHVEDDAPVGGLELAPTGGYVA